MARAAKRLPFAFHKRYCDGHKSEYGWVADGRSDLAETELAKRLELLMIKRDRSVIWKDTPPKMYDVIRIETGVKDEKIVGRLANETSLFKELEKTLEFKIEAICEKVMPELIVGEKTIIWTLTRSSVDIMADAMEKETSSKDVSARMRETRCRIWATHGDASVKTRFDIATDFREHKGSGVLIATMDSIPDSISLFGATTEHYAQLHYLPGPMEQTANRPYLEGVSRLHIFYYIAKGTIDEHMERLLLPRLMTADKIGKSGDAVAQAAVFSKKKETFQDFIARLTANMPDEGEISLGTDDAGED